MIEPVDPRGSSSSRRSLEEFAERARMLVRKPSLDAATAEVLDVLDSGGVDALLLKGAPLARVLYREGEHRGYFDIDLLVAPTQFAAAARLLVSLGYGNLTERQGIDDVAGVQHAEVFGRPVPGFGIVFLDLHWQLEGCHAPPQAVWDVLHARRDWVEVGGRRAPTLDRPALALHLALHVAQHGATDVKAIADLNRGLERWSEEIWRESATLARRFEADEAFAAGLRLVPPGIELADSLGLPPADAVLWAIAHRDVRPRGTFHLQAFAEASGLRGRLRVLRRSLLPKRAWIVSQRAWADRGRIFLVTAYALHLLRAPVWALRAWRHARRARRELRSR